MTHEAQTAGGSGHYPLNSYAFHPRALVNTLGLFLGKYVTQSKIEEIFTDQ
jgi:hypothetical protein